MMETAEGNGRMKGREAENANSAFSGKLFIHHLIYTENLLCAR